MAMISELAVYKTIVKRMLRVLYIYVYLYAG